MQVYGAQSRMRNYTSLLRRATVDGKFSQIIGRLDDLTKQVWALSAGDSPDPVGIPNTRHVFPVHPLQCICFPLSMQGQAKGPFLRMQSCSTVPFNEYRIFLQAQLNEDVAITL